jgi:hypothetical protein
MIASKRANAEVATQRVAYKTVEKRKEKKRKESVERR